MTYSLDFDMKSKFGRLYKELRNAGVSDLELDQGFYKDDYVNKKNILVDSNDNVIQKEEVLDYALERYDKYHAVVRKIFGFDIPWLLDDFEPKTTFDQDIRKKLESAITFFRTEIANLGFKPEEERYQELMGLCVYAYVMADKKTSTDTEVTLPKGLWGELRNAGLVNVSKYIKENGGLNLANTNDCNSEATALDALKMGCGACTEDSSVLYAVYKMAGLKTSFAHGEPNSGKTELNIKAGELHTSVALMLPGKTRYLDPSMQNIDAGPTYKQNFAWWTLETGRQFIGSHLANLGVNYLTSGNSERSVQELKKAVEIDPYNAFNQSNLGTAYFSGNDNERAIMHFSKAVELKPDEPFFHFQLGQAYLIVEEYTKAEVSLKKSIKLDPNSPEAHIDLGIAYSKMGDYTKAIEEYKLGLKLTPNNSNAQYNLGLAYHNNKDWENAIVWFNNYLQNKPDDADAYYFIGNAYSEKKDLIKAAYNFQIVLKKDPNNAAAHIQMGDIYVEQGELNKAIESYRQAIKIEPKNEVARFNIGKTIFNQGVRLLNKGQIQQGWAKLVEARKELKEANKIIPTDTDIEDLLKQLESTQKSVREEYPDLNLEQ